MPVKRKSQVSSSKPGPIEKPTRVYVAGMNVDSRIAWLGFYFLMLILTFIIKYFNNSYEGVFSFTLGFFVLVVLVNAFWLTRSFAKPFLLPYIFTMLKTEHFINFIKTVSHWGQWWEKICLVGMFLGFGITGVDYWYARKLGGWKRILLLIFSSLALASFFYFFLGILFSVPVLAPLYWFCMLGFVVLGFGGMSLVMLIGYGIISFQGLFIGKQLCPAVAPVIPGAPIPGIGVAIPLIAWISLAMVLILHEFSHGVMMAYYKEKIKSVGILLAGVFPVGAFVEQEDKTFDQLDEKKALMVLSAGSAINIASIIVAVIFLYLFTFAAQPFGEAFSKEYEKTYSGVKINSVSDTVSYCGLDYNAPAKGNLFAGDVVKSINGVDINNIGTLNTEFAKAKGKIDFVILRKDDSNILQDVNVSVTPVKFEDLGLKRIGVEFGLVQTDYKMDSGVVLIQEILSTIYQIILFFAVLSFAAGSFNYFPSDPFDGGRMAKIILLPYFGFMKFESKKETQKFIGRLFIWLFLLSMLMNMIPYATMMLKVF